MAVSVCGRIITATLMPAFWVSIIAPLTLSSIFITLSFIYMDKLCSCCCSCFLSAPGQISVFNPDHPENSFIIGNDQAVEVKEVEENTIENNIPIAENEPTGERISLTIIGDGEFEEDKMDTVNDIIDDTICHVAEEQVALVDTTNDKSNDTISSVVIEISDQDS